MKCPSCGAAELIHDTLDVPYTYKGETTTIPEVTGDFCQACGEIILDRLQGEMIEAFRREMASRLDSGKSRRATSLWAGESAFAASGHQFP